MLFNSLHFLVFFPVVVLLYFLIPPKVRYLWLLAASYYFYMSWNPKYAVLIAFSTAVTYASGRLLERAKTVRGKKWVVFASFLINLGILAYFKYFDFFLGNVNRVLGRLGIQAVSKPFDVLLPVGISFYTFQALSYTMDVYRGEIAAEKDPFRYALFVSFFPQLVAGPIERSKNLLTQVREVPLRVKWDQERVAGGLILMIWGLFQKMVIADRLSPVVDGIFGTYFMHQSTALVLGALAFAVQIYCDFSGYSTIAIGAARVMGFSLMENFEAPYFACSIQEFWRRWHISLSTWFRDYLYIPLGGSRCGKWKHYRNLLITFCLSGLWHGAAWHFVVWGMLHGLYQVIGMELKPLKERIVKRFSMKTDCFSYRLGQMAVTFVLVDLAWIFFRADSLRIAVEYLYRMFTRLDWWSLFDGSWYSWGMDRQDTHVLWFALLLLFLADLICYLKKERLDEFLRHECLWFRWLVVLVLLFSTLILGKYGIDVTQIQFLYFQF